MENLGIINHYFAINHSNNVDMYIIFKTEF